MAPTQYTTMYNPIGIFSAQGDWYQLPAEYNAPIGSRPSSTGIFASQPQPVYPSYAEKATQTTQPSHTSESNRGQERPRGHQRSTSRSPVSQVAYKPTKHHVEFTGFNVIEFVVGGEGGIRLSDASEGNWAGFEGRDDRSLFEGDRLQIIIRINFVGCSPWQSKICTTDFTAKRRPITRMKLAAEVAKSMKKFIAREKLNGHVGDHPRCGWGDASLENLFLTRIVRVSPASWQPEILVERPSVAPQAASSSSSSP